MDYRENTYVYRMQIRTLKWIVTQFPRSVRGVIAVMLFFIVVLFSVVVFLDKRVSTLQVKLDSCIDLRYSREVAIKDSLALEQREMNDQLKNENVELRKHLEEVKELSMKFKTSLK